jgi:hypothetical protein
MKRKKERERENAPYRESCTQGGVFVYSLISDASVYKKRKEKEVPRFQFQKN